MLCDRPDSSCVMSYVVIVSHEHSRIVIYYFQHLISMNTFKLIVNKGFILTQVLIL